MAVDAVTMQEDGTRIDEEGPWLPVARMAASDWAVTGRERPAAVVGVVGGAGATVGAVIAADGLGLGETDVGVTVVDGALPLVMEPPQPATSPATSPAITVPMTIDRVPL